MDRIESSQRFSVMHLLIRLVVSSIILSITALLTPGFAISGIWALVTGAAVLSILDWAVSRLVGVNATPFTSGFTGFVLAAVILYATQFFVPGFIVSIPGAIIGAIIYGIVDAIIPGRGM